MNLKSYMRGIGLGMIVTAMVLHFSGNSTEKLTDMQIKARARELGMIDNSTLANSISSNEDEAVSSNESISGDDANSVFEIIKEPVSDNGSVLKKDNFDVSNNTADKQNNDKEETDDTKKEIINNKDNGLMAKESNNASATETTKNNNENKGKNKEENNNEADKDKNIDNNQILNDSTTFKEKTEENIENKKESQKKGTEDKKTDNEKKEDNNKGMEKNTENSNANVGNEADTTTDYVTVTIVAGDSSYNAAKKVVAAGLRDSAATFDQFLCEHNYDKTLRVGTYKIPKNASDDEIGKLLNGK